MKKSKIVSLVLISAAFAACNKTQSQNSGASGDWGEEDKKKVYMRSDTTARYSRTYITYRGGGYYYAFRPYGVGSGSGYRRTGYYSNSIAKSSNVGSNSTKSSITRGGFGRSGFRASGS